MPQRLPEHAGVRGQLRDQQAARRAAEQAAAQRLLAAGPVDRVLDEAETRVLFRLLTRAMEARSVVAGQITGGSGGNDALVIRLVPAPVGSAVRTAHGILHLPGLRLEVAPARQNAPARRNAPAPGNARG